MKRKIYLVAVMLLCFGLFGAGDDMIQLNSTSLKSWTMDSASGNFLMSTGTNSIVWAGNQEGAKRIVNIYVVDPDENVPLEKSTLYQKEGLFTDKTDRELYFDIPIKSLLKTHNAERVLLERKGCDSEKCKKLPEAKIRDLKMVVVEIARF